MEKEKEYLQKELNKNIITLYNILMDSDIINSIKKNQEVLLSLIPSLQSMIGFDHKHPHHRLDVWEHTLYALSLSEEKFDIRLSLLLHDIGKPICYTEEDGIRHFENHPQVSAQLARNILLNLGFNLEYVNKICFLIELHDTPITPEDIATNYDLTYLRFAIQKCDALAHNPAKLEKRQQYLETTKQLFIKR